MTVSDEVARDRTGRGWEEWFDLLDEWGAGEREHKEVAQWVAEEHGVSGWWAQSITVSYERARGGRAVGEKADGFSMTASKTVAVPVEALYDAFVDPTERGHWLPDADLSERTSTRPKGARYDWGDGSTRVIVAFDSKGEAKSSIHIEHAKLPNADEMERMKEYWRPALAQLKAELEG